MKKKLNKGTSATVVEAPKTTKTKKKSTTKPVSKEKVAKLDDANATSVTKKVIDKKITDKKDLKYIYPKSADDIPKRKAFRAEVRRKLAAYARELGKLQYSKLPEDQELFEKKSEEYHRYQVKVLVNPSN